MTLLLDGLVRVFMRGSWLVEVQKIHSVKEKLNQGTMNWARGVNVPERNQPLCFSSRLRSKETLHSELYPKSVTRVSITAGLAALQGS